MSRYSPEVKARNPLLLLVGVLALVSYTVVWLRLFLPLSGHGLLVYGLSNPVTLGPLGGFGFLLGKKRKRP